MIRSFADRMMCGGEAFIYLVKRASWLIAVASSLAILTGCARTENGDGSPLVPVVTRTLVQATATPSALPVALTTSTPTDLPAPATLAAIAVSESDTAGSLIPESGRVLIDAIMAELVTEHDRDPADIRLLSLERFVWPDESWGCEKRRTPVSPTPPGPGYRMLFSAGSRIYVYHTDERETFFQCDDRDWLALEGQPVPLDPIAQSMVDLSVHDATKRLGVTVDELRLTSLLAIDWPDSSIGCPKPSADYAEQLTTGYRIVLRADSETLIYHTSIRHIIKCDPSEEILPGFLRRAWPGPTPTPDAAS